MPPKLQKLVQRLLFGVPVGLALLEAAAWARAGGGGHYSGGGHFSGGHYSGGHSSGGGGDGLALYYLIRFDIWLLLHYPQAGIPLNIFFGYIFYKLRIEGLDAWSDRTLRRGAAAQSGLQLKPMRDAIEARDPSFDLDRFRERASAAFVKVQEAWSRQDLRPARPFLSDGVMERFSLQIEMQRAEGLRNSMEQVRVLETQVLQLEADAHFDAVHLRILARAVDTDVSLQDGRRLRGDGMAEEFEEVWTFLRRPGAKTLAKPGLLEGSCPNCGAGLEIADSAQCASCKSWVNSGEYDWVLCEITQSCEWSPRAPDQEVPGYSRLAEADPGLNSAFLEDRASAVFWRWQYALWKGDASQLRSVASEGFCAQLEGRLKAEPLHYRDAAAGSAVVLALEETGKTHRAHVAIKWSGGAFLGTDAARAKPLGGGLYRHVFVLERRRGIGTDLKTGLSSLRCPSCGAAPSRRDIAACEYCTTSFNDGSRGWVLADIVVAALWTAPPVPEPERRRSEAAAEAAGTLGWQQAGTAAGRDSGGWAAPLSPLDAFSVMAAAMAASDGIDDGEMAQLQRYAHLNKIPPERAQALIEAAESGRSELPRPRDASQAMACLRGLVRLAIADGTLTSAEKRTLVAYGRRVTLTSSQINSVFRSEREEAERAAKAAIAEAKRREAGRA